ncbi:HalOD1 output domain-containing protein [Natronolimnobius baerhuensis]|uniref:Halobacterial output domain-containing protein n=1 Tax=Natronolimnobius baerhuensis TaxID=253108 RepID=A0A202E5F1_9EURY|nr:HalOD1 output domain-containing protein [Natronolimnobius baerhuensis]OVE83424.1 hypothetical protein B2G88_13310 [Natronolimnobius baerhuensis]
MSSTDDTTDSSDGHDGTYITTVDPTGPERVSDAVISSVATVCETEPTRLEPLYDAIDPDALNALVSHAHRVGSEGTHELWFVYEGHDIGVRTDGEIHVCERTEAN